MMICRAILAAMVMAVSATVASAQDPRVELSGTAGWTFSGGVNVGAVDDSPIRVDPKDAFSWGARLGFNLSPNVELGFLFNSQGTDLEASGIFSRSVPQTIYNYHGYFAYNFGDTDAAARPYILGGLGATQGAAIGAGVGTVGAAAGSAKAAVIPAQSAQAFTLSAPLQVDVMTSVAVR